MQKVTKTQVPKRIFFSVNSQDTKQNMFMINACPVINIEYELDLQNINNSANRPLNIWWILLSSHLKWSATYQFFLNCKPHLLCPRMCLPSIYHNLQIPSRVQLHCIVTPNEL